MHKINKLSTFIATLFRRRPVPRIAWAWLPGAVTWVALTACGTHAKGDEVREHVVFHEDFEQLDGWVPEANVSLTTERAHSGRYSVRVDKEHPYSITYHLTLGKAFSRRPRHMRLSTWAWVGNPNDDARLILAINSGPDTPPLLSTQLYLADYWPFKRWTHISRDIDIPPPGFPSQSRLIVYFWNNGISDPVYTDDWELTELH